MNPEKILTSHGMAVAPEFVKIHGVFKRITPDFPSVDKAYRGCFIYGAWSLAAFEALSDIRWRADEKIDGTNIRVTYHRGPETVSFAGRTKVSEPPKRLVAKLQSLFPVEKFQAIWGADSPFALQEGQCVALHGEGYGQGIQGAGRHYLPKDIGFILFDVRISSAQPEEDYRRWTWLERHDVEAVAAKMEIPATPVIQDDLTIRQGIVMAAHGFQSKAMVTDTDKPEGIVLRPRHGDLFDRFGNRMILKLKLCDLMPPRRIMVRATDDSGDLIACLVNGGAMAFVPDDMSDIGRLPPRL